jgi:hypothetical protein
LGIRRGIEESGQKLGRYLLPTNREIALPFWEFWPRPGLLIYDWRHTMSHRDIAVDTNVRKHAHHQIPTRTQ